MKECPRSFTRIDDASLYVLNMHLDEAPGISLERTMLDGQK